MDAGMSRIWGTWSMAFLLCLGSPAMAQGALGSEQADGEQGSGVPGPSSLGVSDNPGRGGVASEGEGVGAARVVASSVGSVLVGGVGLLGGALAGAWIGGASASSDGTEGLGSLAVGGVLGAFVGGALGAGIGAHLGPLVAGEPPGNLGLSLLGSTLGALFVWVTWAGFSALSSSGDGWPNLYGPVAFTVFVPLGGVLGDVWSVQSASD